MALIVSPAGVDSPEDLSILYSNRAACYLKDGNSNDCIQDCSRYVNTVMCLIEFLCRREMRTRLIYITLLL